MTTQKKDLFMLVNKELERIDWSQSKLSLNYNTYRKRVIGDGSCYFHAIIDAFFLPIRTGVLDGQPFDRFQFVRKFRADLAKLLLQPRPGYGGKTYYETLSRGELKDLSTSLKEVSIENMMNLLNSGNSVSYIYHELISDVLDLDIYILNAENEDVYMIDSDLNLYYKGRNSIVLFYLPGHFELVSIMRKNELITYFEAKDPFIKKIKKRLNQIKAELKP